ncbi:MAG TPA: PASTA domain-containing protein [Vicinamibacterales bacterium]|nr:PASTA domain-containing protein [Vicinamibacterales bacterium]
MSRSARARSFGRTVLIAAGLLATYALFAAGAMRVALRAREVVVPALVGLEFIEAGRAMDEAGLTIKVDDSRPFSPTVAAGRIASQDPAAGAVVRRGRSVRVWLSAGSRASIVPALVGESERTAQARVLQEGFEISSVAEIRSSDLPPGIVVAQDPAPGSRHTRVGVLVNRGERAAGFVMPDLIGTSADAAVAVLRSHGLRVSVVSQQPYPGTPPGIVLRQSPSAGFQAAPDQPISLEVSR